MPAAAADPAPAQTLPRTHPGTLRAAWWTLRALRRVRGEVQRHGIEAGPGVPAPPALSDGAIRGVYAVLRRRHVTCLERSLVLQRWLAAHGDSRAVIIGVTRPGDDFHAHAWLEGEFPCHPGYEELTRRAPR